jgi:hypothetical protein
MKKNHCHQTLAQTLVDNLNQIRTQLVQLDAQTLARQCGFLKRKPRKISMTNFLLALVALSAEAVLSLERIAGVIGLVAKVTYTKQALHKRLTGQIEQFLAQVATAIFGQLSESEHTQGLFGQFRRVLLHDSTVEALPSRLARLFPGSGNQRHKPSASLRIQFVTDLRSASLVQCSLSAFTHNDQAAAPDILSVARAGDLILRDLGYFACAVLAALILRGAYFLSRYKHGVGVRDLSGQPLDLEWELRTCGRVDREVLLGAEQTRVRLVALPVPEAVANERRRKARANRDGRKHPSREHLFLMGWNLFVTNVSRRVWPAKALAPLYRLRWRIEMIFKAWKSHLNLREFNARSANLVRLSVMTKLLFCVLVYRFCNTIELLGDGQRHVSLLRLARIIGQCACLLAASVLQITPEQWLDYQLTHHMYYEQRKDRKNFFELLAQLDASLG